MDSEQPRVKNRSWWLTSAHCDVCNVDIRKHHLARHRQSKGHRAREGTAYVMMPSDEAFSLYLAGASHANFRGIERELFDRYSGRTKEAA